MGTLISKNIQQISFESIRRLSIRQKNVFLHSVRGANISLTTKFAWQVMLVEFSTPHQSCIQKMWLGGQTESFQNVGGEGVYDVLTFQKSRRGQELT